MLCNVTLFLFHCQCVFFFFCLNTSHNDIYSVNKYTLTEEPRAVVLQHIYMWYIELAVL